MSIVIDHPLTPKVRSAMLAVFIAFTAFFAAYVDLYLVFDDHAFRSVSRDFWNTFNLTYIAFFALVIAVLITAVVYTFALVRSHSVELANKRMLSLAMIVAAMLSVSAWWLFFTVHGFALSVVAVLSTFGIIFVAAVLTFRNRTARVPYQYAVLPAMLTLLTMVSVIVVTFLSYVTLNTVAPHLFNTNMVELVIVLGVMGVATLIVGVFIVRTMLAGRQS